MPLIINTPFRSSPVGWELMSTSAPFGVSSSGSRPTWMLPGGDVLVGPASQSAFFRDVAIYTPGTDSWASKNDFAATGSPPNMPTTYNSSYGGVYDPISGNPIMSMVNATPAPDHAELFEYIPGGDTWLYRGDWTNLLRSVDVTNLDNGDIFIASSAQTSERDKTEKWDGTSFTTTAVIPQPYVGSPTTGEIKGLNALHTADDGTVYHFGGQQWPTAYASDAIWKYDPTGNSWSLSSVVLPTELRQLNTCRLTGNRVMFLGGLRNTAAEPPNVTKKEVYIFDFATETFTQMTNDFAEPEVPGGLEIRYPQASRAIQLSNGKVMVLYTDNEVYITTGAV